MCSQSNTMVIIWNFSYIVHSCLRDILDPRRTT